MWNSKNATSTPNDIGEARAVRAEADTDLIRLQNQAPYVAKLVSRLAKRRALNHFGEQIQITFTAKGTYE